MIVNTFHLLITLWQCKDTINFCLKIYPTDNGFRKLHAEGHRIKSINYSADLFPYHPNTHTVQYPFQFKTLILCPSSKLSKLFILSNNFA